MNSRNDKSEAELLKEIQTHDDIEIRREAFDALMALGYEDDIKRWVNSFRRGMNLTDGDISEIVSRALYRAWKGLPNFRGDSKLSTWLYRITRNLAINCSLKNKNRDEVFKTVSFESLNWSSSESETSQRALERIAIETHTPEERIEAREIQQKISQIIERLSPNLRTVILLREEEGLTYEQISRHTGLKMGTVKSQIKRAREKIKMEFREWALANYLKEED